MGLPVSQDFVSLVTGKREEKSQCMSQAKKGEKEEKNSMRELA